MVIRPGRYICKGSSTKEHEAGVFGRLHYFFPSNNFRPMVGICFNMSSGLNELCCELSLLCDVDIDKPG